MLLYVRHRQIHQVMHACRMHRHIRTRTVVVQVTHLYDSPTRSMLLSLMHIMPHAIPLANTHNAPPPQPPYHPGTDTSHHSAPWQQPQHTQSQTSGNNSCSPCRNPNNQHPKTSQRDMPIIDIDRYTTTTYTHSQAYTQPQITANEDHPPSTTVLRSAVAKKRKGSKTSTCNETSY